MQIKFAKHAIDRYKERLSRIDAKAIENWDESEDRLVREIMRTGSWYYSSKTGAHFCVVRNLKVYVGFLHNRVMTIITAYAYTKKMRSLLNRCEKLSRDMLLGVSEA